MKGRTILLDHLEGREAAALMVDGKLDDLFVEGDAPPPGTIWRARADRRHLAGGSGQHRRGSTPEPPG